MFVDSQYRGKNIGVAKMLLDVLLMWSKNQGIRQIYLGTRSEFIAAQRFYEKNGFQEIQPSILPETFLAAPTDKKFYVYQNA
jgi:ribosomal protein S18 acetylase RimI-like enzyme